MPASSSRRAADPARGVALLAALGILSLLAILAVSLLRLADLASAEGASARARRGAALAAESGLAYTAARLSADGDPRPSGPSGRGDDWTRRESPSVPLETALNPSYGHGEPWTDGSTGTPGAHEPGETWLDRDGNGRFSAWSGRLRTGHAGHAATFTLGIDAADGKIPLNAGLGSNLTETGLAHVLDNLGVQCGLSTRRWNIRTGTPDNPVANHIHRSALGQDLLARRPPQGYASMNAVRATLAGLGYAAWEREAVVPFLCLGPYDPILGFDRAPGGGGAFGYVPVNLRAAPREVLAALWMYLTVDRNVFLLRPGDPAAPPPVYTRVGPSPPPGFDWSRNMTTAILFRDEAERLAERVIAWRASAERSWRSLLADFLQNAPWIFAPECDAFVTTDTELERQWIEAKAELAFQAIALDPHPYPSESGPLAAWAGWGIDRNPLPGFQPTSQVPFPLIRPVALPGDPPVPGAQFDDPFVPFLESESDAASGHGGGAHPPPVQGKMAILGGEIGPVLRFSATCLGRSDRGVARISGTFRARERLTFTTQEDFENRKPGKYAQRGITNPPEGLPEWMLRHDVGPDAVAGGASGETVVRTRPRVTTLPRWNCRAIGDHDDFAFATACGAVTLAGRESGIQGARLYWPFKEDFDGLLNNGGSDLAANWTNGPEGDFWHEVRRENPWPFPPARPYPANLHEADSHNMSPFQVSQPNGAFSSLRLPGFTEGTITPFAVEGWFGPQSQLDIRMMSCAPGETLNQPLHVTLTAGRSGTRPGLQISLHVRGLVYESNEFGDVFYSYLLFSLPSAFGGHDDLSTSPVSWGRHVALAVSCVDNVTSFHVFVDGEELPFTVQTPPLHLFPAAGQPFLTQTLVMNGVDDIKWHDDTSPLYSPLSGVWDGARIRQERDLGHFLRSGTYTSPEYRFDAPARLREVQWTGITPPGMDGSMRIRLDLVTADGTILHDALGPAGPPEDLSHLPTVVSLRYRVIFDCAVPESLMRDAPVFESIWFTFERRGRAPAWSDLSSD